jgi:tRNA-dihydrouridine synthase B
LSDAPYVDRHIGGKRKVHYLHGAAQAGLTVTRSELEVSFLEFIDERRLPPHPTNGWKGFEVDCLWREQRLAVELDSRAFHATSSAFERDRDAIGSSRRPGLAFVKGHRPAARAVSRRARARSAPNAGARCGYPGSMSCIAPEQPALQEPWSLGGLRLANRLVLAPLAGIGNWFVRLQAKRFGAGLVVSEMVSSFGLAYGNERTVREFLRIHPDEHPVSIQLFGHDSAIMREAASMAADSGADLIDINMGCPVKKVCKTGAGAALLDDPEKAIAIARAAAEGSGLPVTVKLRPGRTAGDRAGVELARRLAAEAGVAGIAFHPRHASQQHSGGPDYGLARELATALDVPVILSGGLSDEDSALRAYATSGTAALMLARGSFGNPWRFGRLLGTYDGEPTAEEVVRELEWVIEAAEDHLGRERAGRYLRKFYPWYADTLGLTRRERQALVSAPTTAAAREALAALGAAEPALAA